MKSCAIRIYALCSDCINGEHFSVVKTGKWAEVLKHLNFNASYVGGRQFFIEGVDGKLRPLMA